MHKGNSFCAGALRACLTGAVAMSCAPAAAPAAEAPRSWHFAVLLDGKPIGEHSFALTHHADQIEVESRAHFRVRALFVPLYGYDHEAREIWRDGCLLSLDAHTSDNGHESQVHGELANAAFAVQGPHGHHTFPACVKSFAYWDPRILTEPRLLNAQTGDYEEVEVRRIANETVRARGVQLDSEHYQLRARSLRLDLWYSAEKQWLALESRIAGGATLRYEMR